MKYWLVIVALAGCAGSAKPQEDLIFDVRGYQEGLRWRRYEDAAARLEPSAREGFLDRRDEVDDELRIDDYEILRVTLAAKGERAAVQVKYTWHMDSVGVVHDTVMEQTWEHHHKGWFLVAEAHKRGEEMPGEAAAPAAPEGPPAAENGMRRGGLKR